MYSEINKYLEKNRKRKIVIYGSIDKLEGDFAELKDTYDIYYMDFESESMQNKEYLSLEQAAQLGIDYIMLIDQMIFRQGAFQQLLAFCNRYNVPLIDVKGRRLDLICNDKEEKVYSSKEDILDKITSHTYISFDIFDTLLMRKTISPEDVWKIVEKKAQKKGYEISDFALKRIVAQDELGLSNPDIDDIYENLCRKYQISGQQADFYKDLEVQTEREMLILRQDVVDIYKRCLEVGKKVFLISDMYLPESTLRGILEEKGITGYDGIYISCDHKQLKLQGLLETYKAQQKGDYFLHIGDHAIYDGVCAALAGMDYCLIPSPLAMAKKTLLWDALDSAVSISERLLLGLIVSKAMNSPFRYCREERGILVDTEYEYGYVFCASLVIRFVIWMAAILDAGNYEKVLFAARDGYILKRMYEIICNSDIDNQLPGGAYFYTSRKAAVMTNINNEAYINMIIDISADMSPENIMRERFGLSSDEIKDYDINVYGDSIHKYVWEHAELIFKRADEAKCNYFRYMGKEGLKIGKKYAFIDFVSSGTTQKALMRIVPFDLEGIYVGWNGSENKEDVHVNAMFDGTSSYFMRHYKMVETFMTSQEPSLKCFDEIGSPVFANQDRTEKELAYINDMQVACVDLLQELLAIQTWREINLGEEFVDRIFAAKDCAEITMPDSVLNGLTLMDDWKQEKSLVEELDK